MVYKNHKIHTLSAAPVIDEEAIDWAENLHLRNLNTPPFQLTLSLDTALADGIERANLDPKNDFSMIWVASALSKVVDTMNKDIQLKMSEKRDAKQKST